MVETFTNANDHANVSVHVVKVIAHDNRVPYINTENLAPNFTFEYTDFKMRLLKGAMNH